MVAPVFDQFAATGGWGAAAAHTNSYTLTGGARTNRIMVVGITYQSANTATNSVVSVTDTNGYTWQKLTAQSFIGQPAGGLSVQAFCGLEVWYAYGASWPASGGITVTLANAPDHANFLSFLASGVVSAVPWDSNSSLPAVNVIQATAAQPTMSVNTTTANTMVIAFNCSQVNYESQPVTFGGVNQDFGAQSAYSAGGSWYSDIWINGKSYSGAVQSGLSVVYPLSLANQLSLCVALTADAQASHAHSFGSVIS